MLKEQYKFDQDNRQDYAVMVGGGQNVAQHEKSLCPTIEQI